MDKLQALSFLNNYNVTNLRNQRTEQASVTPKFTQTACNTVTGNPNHPECRSAICGKGCYYLA